MKQGMSVFPSDTGTPCFRAVSSLELRWDALSTKMGFCLDPSGKGTQNRSDRKIGFSQFGNRDLCWPRVQWP